MPGGDVLHLHPQLRDANGNAQLPGERPGRSAAIRGGEDLGLVLDHQDLRSLAAHRSQGQLHPCGPRLARGLELQTSGVDLQPHEHTHEIALSGAHGMSGNAQGDLVALTAHDHRRREQARLRELFGVGGPSGSNRHCRRRVVAAPRSHLESGTADLDRQLAPLSVGRLLRLVAQKVVDRRFVEDGVEPLSDVVGVAHNGAACRLGEVLGAGRCQHGPGRHGGYFRGNRRPTALGVEGRFSHEPPGVDEVDRRVPSLRRTDRGHLRPVQARIVDEAFREDQNGLASTPRGEAGGHALDGGQQGAGAPLGTIVELGRPAVNAQPTGRVRRGRGRERNACSRRRPPVDEALEQGAPRVHEFRPVELRDAIGLPIAHALVRWRGELVTLDSLQHSEEVGTPHPHPVAPVHVAAGVDDCHFVGRQGLRFQPM